MMKTKKYKVFSSPREIGKYLLCAVKDDNLKIVSFDVFDTLIHRRVHPDAVVDAVANWLKLALAKYGLHQVMDAADARQLTYLKLIHEKASLGLDLDVSLDELVLPWVRQCVGEVFEGDETLAKELAEIECEYEIESSFCCPDFLNLVKELKNRGVRVVFTSDMYLGAKYVERILNAKGYLGLFDAGYVSGDYALLKRTGRLFDVVLHSEKISAAELFHVGDSVVSDGLRPGEKGINALVHIYKRMVQRHRRMEYDYKRVKTDPSWMGMVVAQYAEAALEENGTPEEGYGRRVLGPIYTSFIHRILERCREEKIEKIYFMAREGYVLKHLYEELASQVFVNGEEIPEPIYLGVSRLTTFLAAMQSYSLREIVASFNNTSHYSVQTLFAPLRVEAETLATIAKQYGFNDINEPLPPFFMKWPPLIKLLEDDQILQIIRDNGGAMKEGLLSYLEGLGFFDASRVAVVDVGWSGQIQDNLYTALKDQKKCPQIFGFYLGTTLAAHWRKMPKNWMEWTHSDECHLGWSGKAAFEFVQGLEAVVRAPHGTVIGYQYISGEACPLFKSDDELGRKAEIVDDPVIALFQKGIREYCSYYGKALAMFGFGAADTLPYSRMMLDRMVRFPTFDEVGWLSSVSNVSDLGSSEVFAIGSSSGASIISPMRLWNSIKVSFWKYGEVARLKSRFFQVFFAGASAIMTVPRLSQSIDPGIAFHNYKEIERTPGKRKKIKVKKPFFLAEIDSAYSKNLELGRKGARIVRLSDHTKPIYFHEAVNSYFAFRLAMFFCKITGRHIPYQDGVSFKCFVARFLYQYPLVGRIRYALEQNMIFRLFLFNKN